MTKQIAPKISERAKKQLDQLAQLFDSQRVALEVTINDAHQKYIGGGDPVDQNPLEKSAHDRVDSTPELKQHENTIFYAWPNWPEHLAWILSAPISEIVDWAEVVENQ